MEETNGEVQNGVEVKDVTAAAAEPEKNAQQDNAGYFSNILNFSYFFPSEYF